MPMNPIALRLALASQQQRPELPPPRAFDEARQQILSMQEVERRAQELLPVDQTPKRTGLGKAAQGIGHFMADLVMGPGYSARWRVDDPGTLERAQALSALRQGIMAEQQGQQGAIASVLQNIQSGLTTDVGRVAATREQGLDQMRQRFLQNGDFSPAALAKFGVTSGVRAGQDPALLLRLTDPGNIAALQTPEAFSQGEQLLAGSQRSRALDNQGRQIDEEHYRTDKEFALGMAQLQNALATTRLTAGAQRDIARLAHGQTVSPLRLQVLSTVVSGGGTPEEAQRLVGFIEGDRVKLEPSDLATLGKALAAQLALGQTLPVEQIGPILKGLGEMRAGGISGDQIDDLVGLVMQGISSNPAFRTPMPIGAAGGGGTGGSGNGSVERGLGPRVYDFAEESLYNWMTDTGPASSPIANSGPANSSPSYDWQNMRGWLGSPTSPRPSSGGQSFDLSRFSGPAAGLAVAGTTPGAQMLAIQSLRESGGDVGKAMFNVVSRAGEQPDRQASSLTMEALAMLADLIPESPPPQARPDFGVPVWRSQQLMDTPSFRAPAPSPYYEQSAAQSPDRLLELLNMLSQIPGPPPAGTIDKR